jgi:hypothetical protein
VALAKKLTLGLFFNPSAPLVIDIDLHCTESSSDMGKTLFLVLAKFFRPTHHPLQHLVQLVGFLHMVITIKLTRCSGLAQASLQISSDQILKVFGSNDWALFSGQSTYNKISQRFSQALVNLFGVIRPKLQLLRSRFEEGCQGTNKKI